MEGEEWSEGREKDSGEIKGEEWSEGIGVK